MDYIYMFIYLYVYIFIINTYKVGVLNVQMCKRIKY